MTDQKILIEMGKRIAELRKRKGLTQVQLAYSIGMEKSNYNVIEKGKSNPQFLTLIKICDALECQPKDFFDFAINNFLDSPKVYKPRKHSKIITKGKLKKSRKK